MSAAIRRATIAVAIVLVLASGWLPQQRGPGRSEGGAPEAVAQGQPRAPTKAPPGTPAPTPLPVPPRQPPAPVGTSEGGGTATLGPGRQGSGQGQGSSQPPVLSAEQEQRLQARLDRS